MRPREEYQSTSNRSVYNKLRKFILEHDYEIHCGRCAYHKCENDKKKYYYYVDEVPRSKFQRNRYPNWKLVSRNRKQWMPKNLRLKVLGGRWRIVGAKPNSKGVWDTEWIDYGYQIKW